MDQSQFKQEPAACYDQPSAPPPYYAPQPQPQHQPNFVNAPTIVINQQPAPATTSIVHVVSVPDNMGLAIFSCLCCFWPLGLAAIVIANQSRDALARGDVSAAQANGRTARLLSLISIGIGVVTFIIIIVVFTTGSAYRSSSSSNYN